MSEFVPFDYQDVEGIPASESREISWTGITQWVLDRTYPTKWNLWKYGDEYLPLYWVNIKGKRYTVAKNKKDEKVLLLNGKIVVLHGIEDRHINRRANDTHIISHANIETLISEVGRSVLLCHMQPNNIYSRVLPVKCIDGRHSFMLEPPRQNSTIFWEAIVMLGEDRVSSILWWSQDMQYQDQINPASVLLQNGDTILLPSEKPFSALSIARVCNH